MTKQKLTAEEKRTARPADERSEKIAAFKLGVERERAKIIVAKSFDAFRKFESAEKADLLKNALDRVEKTKSVFLNAIDALKRAGEEGERAIERNWTWAYPINIVQSLAADTNAAYASWHVAREAAKDVCAFLNVFCPLVTDDIEIRRREILLSTNVVKPGELVFSPLVMSDAAKDVCISMNCWGVRTVNVNGDAIGVPEVIASVRPAGNYDTEEEAWGAFMALVDVR